MSSINSYFTFFWYFSEINFKNITWYCRGYLFDIKIIVIVGWSSVNSLGNFLEVIEHMLINNLITIFFSSSKKICMYDQVEVGHYENARYVHYSEHSIFQTISPFLELVYLH